ncbi:MAG: hypothetical protein LRY71_08315 [Bacillaceae bacterium]|nr:hypothetical protein [Bacillaceae bacterium]
MAYEINVQDKKIIFSNDKVKNLELFQLEFITDAPKLCRLLRKELKDIHDPTGLINTSKKEHIKTFFDGLEAPTSFRIRFVTLMIQNMILLFK